MPSLAKPVPQLLNKVTSMIRCVVMTLVAFGILLSGVQAAGEPNVILILADDLGSADIGVFAERLTGTPPQNQFYETPHLDALAKAGTCFSQAYVCPLCAPTRASVITGRYAAKIGFMTATPPSVQSFYNQNTPVPVGYHPQDALYWGDKLDVEQALWNGTSILALPSGLPGEEGRNETTLAEVLNEQGYRSAFIGKWHLGGHGSLGYQPSDQGFEEIAYYDAGGSPYFDWRAEWSREKLFHPKMPQATLHVGRPGASTGEEYLTDDLGVQAADFIRSHESSRGDQPFFLYVCPFALHGPWQAKTEDIDHYSSKSTKGWNGHNNETYAGMVDSLDKSIGMLIEALKETGELENTLIVFTSDNGGVNWPYIDKAITSNAPLKGAKGMLFEGGIRVPLFFYWKGKIEGDQWIDRTVDCNDLFPTILELVGIDPASHYQDGKRPAIDGRSLAGMISDPVQGESTYDRETYFWHYPFNVIVRNPLDGLPLTPHSAIRKGAYKLIFDWSGRLHLYDIENDLSEENDLAKSDPERVQALFTELNVWLKENVADRYLPTLNPNYDPSKDTRDYNFVDLRKRMLGDEFAIKPKSPHSVNNLH